MPRLAKTCPVRKTCPVAPLIDPILYTLLRRLLENALNGACPLCGQVACNVGTVVTRPHPTRKSNRRSSPWTKPNLLSIGLLGWALHKLIVSKTAIVYTPVNAAKLFLVLKGIMSFPFNSAGSTGWRTRGYPCFFFSFSTSLGSCNCDVKKSITLR